MEIKTIEKCLLLIVLLIVIIIVSITLGTKTINIFAITNQIDKQIVFELRIPRVIAAIASGITLAASGLLIQTALNNQLADSSILGFQSGATLVALIIMLALPRLYPLLPIFAFIGGLFVFLIIFAVTKHNQNAIFLIVAGIAVSSIIRSLINLISTMYAENLENTVSWLNGSLNTINYNEAMQMLTYALLLIVLTLIITYRLDLLLLDDTYLLSIGVNGSKYRFFVTALAILLAAVSVSFVGTIGFVGLIAPHIARHIVDNRSVNLMPVTILMGAILVSGCDLLQRLIFPVYEIPVGITLSMIGGTYLLALLVRSNNVRV